MRKYGSHTERTKIKDRINQNQEYIVEQPMNTIITVNVRFKYAETGNNFFFFLFYSQLV